MGMQWGEGSIYDGPHARVYWLRLAYRSPSDPQALYLAAFLRQIVTQVLADDDPPPIPLPDPTWSGCGNGLVMAWNGGASDVP